MKRVLTALVLIPVVLLLVFLGPWWHWLFTLAIAVVAALACWELMAMAAQCGANPPRIATVVAICLLFVGNALWPDQATSVFGILSVALILYCTFAHPVEQMLADATTSIFCLFYTGATLMAIPALHEQSNGPSLVVFLLCAVWAGDITALYVGKKFGRHKLAPKLSPNKSWEGALGSVAGSLLVTGFLLWLSHFLATSYDSVALSYPEDTAYWLVLAVIVNVAAQVGDLAESALKRSAGVKDSGTLLPGHGGMLDRIDALLIAAPILWYAISIHARF